MKKLPKLKNGSWKTITFAGCVIAFFFLVVSNLGTVCQGVGKFLGFFSTIFTGIVLAYLINCPACFFNNKVLKNVKSEKKRWIFSVVIALILVFLFLILSVVILIPQLMGSISTFISNLDTYHDTVRGWIQYLGLEGTLSADDLMYTSADFTQGIVNYLAENYETILERSASAGKGIFEFVIAFILCIYFLAEKSSVCAFCKRILLALSSPPRYEIAKKFLSKCNVILSQYVVYNIIDALIIGGINAVFMVITGMPYIGLISFIVGVTNLIPSFGPIIGFVLAGFILVLVNPKQLILFGIFTLILQTCDGYVIKPKLFGNSLGIPGMLVIVGVIVGGKIAGVAGILLATPIMAILDYVVTDWALPQLEMRRAKKNSEIEKSE